MENLNNLKELLKDFLIPSFDKESQLGRSFRKTGGRPNNFNKELFESIKRLRIKIDNGTLKNKDIRQEIEQLADRTGATIGQAQKVINVYLKYYCILIDDKKELIKELDCPLDRTHLKGRWLYKITTMEEYENWQQKLLKSGLRILSDEKYDKNRISRYLKD